MADVVVEVDGNTDGLQAELDELARAARSSGAAMRAMGSDAQRAGASAKSGATKMQRFAKEAEDLNRVSMILGGTLGGVTGGLDDMATLLSNGPSRFVAFAGGAIAAGAALTALGSAVVSALSSTSEFLDELSDSERRAWRPYLENSLAAEDALERLSESGTRLGRAFSETLAPAVTAVADGLADVADTSADVIESGRIGEVVDFIGQLAALASGDPLAFVDQEEGRRMAIIRERSAELVDQLMILEDQYSTLSADVYNANQAFEAQLELEQRLRDQAKQTVEAERERLILLGILEPEAEKARQTAARSTRAVKKETDGLAESMAALGRQTAETLGAMRDGFADVEIDAQTTTDNVSHSFQQAFAQNRAMNQEMTQSDRDRAAENRAMWANRLQNAQSATSQIFAISRQITEMTIQDDKKRAMVNWRLSLTEAIVNTALSTTKALADNPYPINLVYAALALAAGGVAIGQIASNKPKAHIGELLAPDEIALGNRNVMRDERAAVFTNRAVRAIGGEQGVAKLNAGSMPQRGGDTYLVIDGRTMGPVRELAKPDRMVGVRGG